MNRRYPGCSPMTLGVPMWQRRLGFFLSNLGSWVSGWEWGVDHYLLAMDDLRDWHATTGNPQYADFNKFLDGEIGKASCQERDGQLLVEFYPRPGWLGGGVNYVLDGKTFEILSRTFD